jgi:hypothetical protein
MKHLPLLEKILLTLLVIGAILTALNMDMTLTKISLIGLAIIFFLMAYHPIDIPRQENEQLGFSELLALSIVPKVMWIGSAVSSLAIAFYLIPLENKGYKQMLLIGGSSIGICVVLMLVFLGMGVKHLRIIIPVLLRAVPLFAVDLYILLSLR